MQKDIWKSIFKWLPFVDIFRLRTLSNLHLNVGNEVLENKSFLVTTNNIDLILRWVYRSKRITKMILNPLCTQNFEINSDLLEDKSPWVRSSLLRLRFK